MGPDESKIVGGSGGNGNDDDDDYQWVEGVDYEVPDHESHRLDRRSKLDEQCDAWFARLLLQQSTENDNDTSADSSSSSPFCCAGPIADAAAAQLATVPVLVNDVERPRTGPDADIEWTPYVTTKLPWSVLSPAYGLEQFGLPVPRRNAETWRHFDVVGMIAADIDGSLRPTSTSTTTDTNTNSRMNVLQSKLVQAGAWLDDADCAARLIYVNGIFVPELSIERPDVARNLPSLAGLGDDDDVLQFVARLTDGWTDELAAPVPMQRGAPSLTQLSKMSGPNHNVGAASTQFAINSQQGTACFAALNTIQCSNIAYVHNNNNNTSPGSADSAADSGTVEGSGHDDDDDQAPKPVLIVNAVTPDGGVSGGGDGAAAVGVAIHPRTVIIAEPHTHVSVVQQSITITNDDDNDENDSSSSFSRPILYNGYTQVLLKDFANVTHTVMEESGGMPVPGTEKADDAVRALESQRPALQNTVLENIDVHCAGTASVYTGTVLSMGGNGRVRMATAISLLKPTASCNLQGFSLAGGTCRADMKTCIHHIADGCSSRQLQKNMVAGRAVSSFRGRIRVEQSAQQTESQQLSRTVLLTDKCRAWAVPSLEIIADDVQCTHGATVSDLSEEELFYLRSRGLDVAAARNLLMYAFCNDVVQHVPLSVLGTLKSIDKSVVATKDDRRKEGLQMRILRRLENLVPTGERAVKGEYQSI